MDDLNSDPKTVAEDIIKQAVKGEQEKAKHRIVYILEAYHRQKGESDKAEYLGNIYDNRDVDPNLG